jgi:hypothetical protein
MKQLFLSVFVFLCFFSVSAQDHVILHLAPRLGAAPFHYNQAVSAGSYSYKITRLEYYVSEVKITHDGGQVTSVDSLWLLVRPALDSMYDLGAFPSIQNVEGVQFSVGVDSSHNHLDPASYPPAHPLAPKNPEMQWGWSAGYRFIAIEGKAGTNYANIFQVHALGDENYKTVNLTTPAENTNAGKVIHVTADYAHVIAGLNVSGGLIVHATTGAAVTVLNNMQNIVFTSTVTAVVDPGFTGSFSISPNPAAAGTPKALMDLPAGHDYVVTLTDLTGRLVFQQAVPAGARELSLNQNIQTGLYFAQLWEDHHAVATEKLIIQK